MDDNNETALRQSESWGWVHLLKSKDTLARGLKTELSAIGEIGEFLTPVANGLCDDGQRAWRNQDYAWLIDHLTAEARRPAEYAIKVLAAHGDLALFNPPQIIVGTIHSVKGGEADTVYLIPDLSAATVNQCEEEGQDARDAVVRLFYVAMTRARRRLVLCQPNSKAYVEVPA